MSRQRKLVNAAKSGDRQALEVLLEDRRALLKTEALRWLGNNDQADDAVQETFLTALLKLDQLRDPEKFQSWLFSILYNICRMYLRHENRKASEFTFEDVRHGAPDSLEVLENIELQKWIKEVLEKLTFKQRMVVLLRYFSNCNTYDLIAKMLSIPIGTVRSRLHQAHRMLKKHLSVLDQNDLHKMNSSTSNHLNFYRDLWADFYAGNRERFLSFYNKELHLRFTSGKTYRGRERWAEEWDKDLESGVRFKPEHVVSTNAVTIIEGPFKNPPHDPYHCPPSGSFVFFKNGSKINRVHLHYAKRI